MHCLAYIEDRAVLSNQRKFSAAVDFLLIHLISKWGVNEGKVNEKIRDYDPPADVLGVPYEDKSA